MILLVNLYIPDLFILLSDRFVRKQNRIKVYNIGMACLR